MVYSPKTGSSIHQDFDLEGHQNLEIPIHILDKEGETVLNSGLIQGFSGDHVTVNGKPYDRKQYIFVSGPED